MKRDRHSRTAENAAGLRALHQTYEAPLVFADPPARRLASALWRAILHWPGLSRRLADLPTLTANRGQILARSRYAEDALAAALAAGMRQYVIVGAGMDSYALRHRGPAGLTVFEVDFPASQQRKQRRLQRLGLQPGLPVSYCGVDFEREGLFEGLARSPYDPGRPAFFSWLGVSYYLSEGAITALFRAIAGQAAAGSELVFDYAIPEAEREGEDARVWVALKRGAERQGEPLLSCFSHEAIQALVRASGLLLVEHLDPLVIHQRYFAAREDGLWSLATGLIRCRVPD